MNERLLKLLLAASKQNKYLDNSFMRDIVKEIVLSYNLKDFVSRMVISGNDKMQVRYACAQYCNNSKTIFINKPYFEEIIMSDGSEIDCIEKEYIPFYRALYVLELITHELNHAQQYKIMNPRYTGNVPILLRECELNNDENIVKIYAEIDRLGLTPKQADEYIAKCNAEVQKVYDENYDLDVSERLADCLAKRRVVDVSKPLEKECPKLLLLNNFLLLDSLTREYCPSIEAPTIRYFDSIGRKDKLSQLDFYDEDKEVFIKKSIQRYGLNARMYLGLPITEDEYDDKMHERHEMNQRLFI